MNIVECARKLKEGQIAFSKDAQVRVRLRDPYYLEYVNPDGTSIGQIDFDANEWLADDWEIETEWIEFFEAWRERERNGKKISSEYWHESVHYDSNFPSEEVRLSEMELRGRWRIIN